MTSLRLIDLHSSYGGMSVLRGLSWSISAGQIGVIVGRSGCGKSTLLHLIAGLIAADDGRIELDGVDLRGVPPHRRDVAMGFQSDPLYPHRTLRKTLTQAAAAGKNSDPSGAVAAISQRLGIAACLDSYPQHISGGQRQRASMAKTILRGARVCLFDEPLTSVDSMAREEQMQMLLQIREDYGRDRVMIVVTHDGDEAIRLADELAVMHDGRLIQTGPPSELWNAPQTRVVAESLGRPLINWLDRSQLSPEQSAWFDERNASWDGLAIRPSNCVLRWGQSEVEAFPDDSVMEFPATVVATRPFGEMVWVELRCFGAVDWRVVLSKNSMRLPIAGELVGVRVRRCDAVAVHDDREA